MNQYYVYIVASKKNGTLYVGVTNNLRRRIYEHKRKLVPGFSARYSVDRLVYFETAENPETAILREKQLKKFNRDWKIALIERANPDWNELDISLCTGSPMSNFIRLEDDRKRSHDKKTPNH